jgi:hypothetical protein
MITERVQTTTRDEYMPLVVMTTLKGSPLVENILKRQKKWSGTNLKIPVDVLDTVSMQFFDGFDTLATTTANDRRFLTFEPKSVSYDIAIDRNSVDLNTSAGENAFLDLVKIEAKSAAQKFSQQLASAFYNGTGAGKTFNGLANIIDDGSVAVIYGGLSRTTYPTLKSTVTSVAGALTLAAMRQLYDAISDGGEAPDEIYTTFAVRSAYESLNVPTLRTDRGFKDTGANMGDLGYAGAKSGGLAFKGLPMYADKMCPTGTLHMINSEYLNFYAVTPSESESINLEPGSDMKDVMYTGVMGFGIKWSGWKEPVNQYAYIGHLMLHGNLVSENPRRLGKLTNIT